MKLFDTQLLIFAAVEPARLSERAAVMMEEPVDDNFFSLVSIWEIAIKHALKRVDFPVTPQDIYKSFRSIGFRALAIDAKHIFELSNLPRIHNDPFDRLLLAQARMEGCSLVTVDEAIGRYGEPVLMV